MSTALLLTLGLWACSDDGTSTEDTGTGPSDSEDADTDTDADTDSDTDTDTDTGASPCPRYFAWHAEGAERHYETGSAWEADAGYSGTWSQATTRFDEDTGAVEVASEYFWEIDGFSDYVTRSDEHWSCDGDGAWLDRTDSTSSYNFDGVTYEYGSTVTYSAEGPTLPHDLQVGDTWTVVTVYTTTFEGGSSTDGASTTYTASLLTTRTTDAGTFDVLQVDFEDDAGVVGTYYLHETLGLVSNTMGDLTAYSD